MKLNDRVTQQQELSRETHGRPGSILYIIKEIAQCSQVSLGQNRIYGKTRLSMSCHMTLE